MTQHKILVIDGAPRELFTASRILGDSQYQVSLAQNSASGMELIKGGGFSLVLLDLSLEDTAPLSILENVRKENPEAMVVMQCERPDTALGQSVFMLGADDYIFKPWAEEELLFRVRMNLEKYELKQKMKLRKSFYSSCCVCKKVRIDDNGPSADRWREVEDFLKEEIGVLLSSTYCPKCAQTAQEDLLVHLGRIKALKVCR